MLRGLIDDAKEFPATMALGALWVVVFLLMLLNRLESPPVPAFGQMLLGNVFFGVSHRYGDMTLAELDRGEIWRAVTSTFVHYNLLHLGMNLYGLYVLGCLVESWYGPGTFAAVYLLLGGGGNALSGLARTALGSDPRMHSGGGSTVVMGLVALCAIVGWRSRTRRGDYLRGQMVGVLLFTAFLGQVLPIIDNWGHAGGAIMGAAIGFAHRPLVRLAGRRVTRWAGVVAVLLLAACGLAQARGNRVEDSFDRLVQAQRAEMSLPVIEAFYRQAAVRSDFEHATLIAKSLLKPRRPRPAGANNLVLLSVVDSTDAEWRAEQARFLSRLDELGGELGSAPTSDEFRRARQLLQAVFDRRPRPATIREFAAHVATLAQRARQNRAAEQVRHGAFARKLW